MKTSIFASVLALTLAFGASSAFAQTRSCADAIKEADADQKLTSNVITPEATRHFGLAKDMMAKNDEKNCLMHLDEMKKAMQKR